MDAFTIFKTARWDKKSAQDKPTARQQVIYLNPNNIPQI